MGRVGRLLNLDENNSKDYLLEARKVLNDNKAPVTARNLVLGSASETALLKNELFIAADQRGDGGTALENARLGRILGFDTWMDQNVNDIAEGMSDVATGTVTNAAAIGATGSQAVAITGYEVQAGEYAVVEGNDQPTYVTAATTAAGDTTAVTLHEANKFATEAGAAITVYKAQSVQGAYPADYTKGITIDGFTQPLQVGQIVSFGTGGSRHTYTVIESEASGSDRVVWLDRPLETALADNDLAFPGPAGAMNLAFHRDALALVTRPLALPNQSMGVMAAVASYNDIAMRVTMQYNSIKQGTYTENSEYEYELDRGQLDTVREGNQVPMDVNLDFVYEFVTTGTGEAITPMDAIKGKGGAAEWVSSSADPCEPYAVDVEVEHIPPCGGADMEISIFPDFRADSKEFDLGEATVSVSGRCNAVEPTISRVSQ